MESIKELETAAKNCLKDLRTIESRVSITEGNLRNMESTKAALLAEINDLIAKKSKLVDFIGSAELNFQKSMDEKLRNLKNREQEILNERATLKAKIFQSEAAALDMANEREKFQKLQEEYLTKLHSLEDKRQAVLAALK